MVKFGDCYFVELALMFSTRSSPGIFCDFLSLFVSCVALLVGIAPFLVLQHLDDVLAVGTGCQGDPVERFHEVFLEEVARVGVRPGTAWMLSTTAWGIGTAGIELQSLSSYLSG